ncbi:TSUP family transporter [Candidatus Actinomarina]|nr:TSUP family transporter [Candidatus Actinomarina sp.]
MEYLYEENTVYIILFCVAFFASLIDSIAGGGGLLTTPSMLLVGISPLNVLATNKFQSCFGTFTSTYNYYKNGLLVDNKKILYFALSFIGSSIGTLLVSRISNDTLESIIPILLIGAAVFFITNKGPSGVRTNDKLLILFNLFIFAIGFYDGFFGPGTGSFFVLTFIVIKGANIMNSTAITKLLNFASNFAAFIIFAIQGYVIWYLGLVMAIAQIAGAFTGSRFAIKNGEKVVRPVLVIVSILLSLRILLG